MPLQKELSVAVEAVRKACQLSKQVHLSMVSEDTITKKDGSPVTVADFGVQAVICHEIVKSFPQDKIVGEEQSGELRTEENRELKDKIMSYINELNPDLSSDEALDAIDKGNFAGGASGRFWTLDPIDGTKGFLRGDQYAIALALIIDGEAALGVLGCPELHHNLSEPDGNRGSILYAVTGEGAFMQSLDEGNSRRIAVDDIADSSQAVICESVESKHTSHSNSQKIADLLEIDQPPVRIDSQCKYSVVSRGDASMYLRLPTSKEYREKIWDHAAGVIIIDEAGGAVSDVNGKPLDFSKGRTLLDNSGVIVTNGKLHDEVISAVQSVLI